MTKPSALDPHSHPHLRNMQGMYSSAFMLHIHILNNSHTSNPLLFNHWLRDVMRPKKFLFLLVLPIDILFSLWMDFNLRFIESNHCLVYVSPSIQVDSMFNLSLTYKTSHFPLHISQRGLHKWKSPAKNLYHFKPSQSGLGFIF